MCEAHVRSLLPEVAVDRAVGVAGTVTTAAAVELGNPDSVHGHVLSRESVVELLNRLAELPLEHRRLIRGLAPARAPVIVAGLVVLNEILARYTLDGITVSERDLLHGVALEAAKLPEPEEGPAPPGAYACC